MKLSAISDKCWSHMCGDCTLDSCNHICHKAPKPVPTAMSEDKWFQIQEDARMDEVA